MTNPTLTTAERRKLAVCEKWIDDGLAKVSEAFSTIRDLRLYKETHSSFDAYCRDRWNLSRRQVDRRIRFMLAVTDSETHGSQPPATERQSRAQTTIKRVGPLATVASDLKVDPQAQSAVDRTLDPREAEPTAAKLPLLKPIGPHTPRSPVAELIEEGEWEPIAADGVIQLGPRLSVALNVLLSTDSVSDDLTYVLEHSSEFDARMIEGVVTALGEISARALDFVERFKATIRERP